uniref:Uncharacterized protein n=1 Tax=Anguilla anguilla TaxID=7936 RepID=A0A0E9XHF9_ANGAN
MFLVHGEIIKKQKPKKTILNDSPYFKKSLQVVNLSQGHSHQHQRLKERPEHNSTVRVVVDCSVYPLPDLHVLLLVLDCCHGKSQLVDHLLQLVLMSFRLHAVPLGGLSNVDGEHDDLGGHGGHLVAEAELVGSVHVSGHGVLSAGLPVAFVNLRAVWPGYLHIDVQEASFGNLKHEAHFGPRVDPFKEALLGMSVYANEVSRSCGRTHC